MQLVKYNLPTMYMIIQKDVYGTLLAQIVHKFCYSRYYVLVLSIQSIRKQPLTGFVSHANNGLHENTNHNIYGV